MVVSGVIISKRAELIFTSLRLSFRPEDAGYCAGALIKINIISETVFAHNVALEAFQGQCVNIGLSASRTADVAKNSVFKIIRKGITKFCNIIFIVFVSCLKD